MCLQGKLSESRDAPGKRKKQAVTGFRHSLSKKKTIFTNLPAQIVLDYPQKIK